MVDLTSYTENPFSSLDKIPLTYMRIFHSAAALRWQVAAADWPDDDESIRKCLEVFEHVYRDAAHGTRVVDVLGAIPSHGNTAHLGVFASLTDSRLDRDAYDAFVRSVARGSAAYTSFYSTTDDCRIRLSPLVRFTPRIELSGLLYGTRASNIRNSFICFRDATAPDPLLVRAGQITSIFLHSRTDASNSQRVVEPFFIVDEYAPLSEDHEAMDPYRQYPLLGTQLFYNHFFRAKAVIRVTDIVAHFAAFTYEPDGIGESCIVVRSLDRVSDSLV